MQWIVHWKEVWENNLQKKNTKYVLNLNILKKNAKDPFKKDNVQQLFFGTLGIFKMKNNLLL
jgi:hypothetical protein